MNSQPSKPPIPGFILDAPDGSWKVMLAGVSATRSEMPLHLQSVLPQLKKLIVGTEKARQYLLMINDKPIALIEPKAETPTPDPVKLLPILDEKQCITINISETKSDEYVTVHIDSQIPITWQSILEWAMHHFECEGYYCVEYMNKRMKGSENMFEEVQDGDTIYLHPTV